ncbi:outer membrane protein assembly factor BamB family protein [Tuwongella immobilis]|uniref:Pyrrolo-quinoline quinone repeat domain-containing protein n=1 Tax=Tuwongella immobilis TaxID=692036 RepID=A0A6C2YGS3_9BACT|nr:PQQ-binding-like beta-propeller repeat protein [Tuwongella immobilis]VIP00708.1 Predicted cell surface protein/ lipoprotein OS=Planctomyces maris DSM 8797 GN=PM8797T_26530 PE=4 SV=1: PQQ_2 [Tuwongella immobilis]VTR96834.1 Predicted cell surface protein/ lipoprotein OS=Planctomyces maris DSM 8797 GN=PM8797T_26530 PE=4 SV=1: PQQ_2 [Tuwongella immobilis]
MRLGRAVLLATLWLLPVGATFADEYARLVTDPPALTAATLDRLNLTQSWRIKLPMDSRANGIALVQPLRDRLYVQMTSGSLVVLDASNGRYLWAASVGVPYTNIFPIAETDAYVYQVNGTRLYCYNRANGVLFFEMDMGSTPIVGPAARDNEVFVCLGDNSIYKLRLPVRGVLKQSTYRNGRKQSSQPEDLPLSPESRSPRFVGSNPIGGPTQFDSYTRPTRMRTIGSGSEGENKSPSLAVLPSLRPPYTVDTGSRTESIVILESLRQPYLPPRKGTRTPSIAVIPPSIARAETLNDIRGTNYGADKVWKYASPRRVTSSPLLTEIYLFAPITSTGALENEGRMIALTLDERVLDFSIDLDGQVPSALSRYGDTAYTSTLNAQTYAMEMNTGRILWRQPGGPYPEKPVASDRELFLGGHGIGIARLNRTTGETMWSFPLAGSIRAINPKFVYAANNRGKLFILDRNRSVGSIGVDLASLEIGQFPVPVVNEYDDRLYLAANDGTIISLHDRTYLDPVRLAPPPPVEAAPKKDAEAPMDAEPKKDDN